MNNKFTGQEKIGEIVTVFLGASNLFKEYKIDFCCGGSQTLAAALQQRNIDEASFLEKLNEAYQKEQQQNNQNIDWRKASYSELIHHIVHTHHEYLSNELPVLSAFVTKVMYRHGMDHPELQQLHQLFHELKEEMEEHLVKEEQTLFPLIQEYEQTGSSSILEQVLQTIEELESEHNHTGELLKEMRIVTNNYQLPRGACRTYTLSFLKLEQLESDMFQHIHLENNVLFPRLLASKKA